MFVTSFVPQSSLRSLTESRLNIYRSHIWSQIWTADYFVAAAAGGWGVLVCFLSGATDSFLKYPANMHWSAVAGASLDHHQLWDLCCCPNSCELSRRLLTMWRIVNTRHRRRNQRDFRSHVQVRRWITGALVPPKANTSCRPTRGSGGKSRVSQEQDVCCSVTWTQQQDWGWWSRSSITAWRVQNKTTKKGAVKEAQRLGVIRFHSSSPAAVGWHKTTHQRSAVKVPTQPR